VDRIERDLLNIIQQEFPLEKRPFAAMAQRLCITEAECLRLLQKLQKEGILREIRPVISWNRAGYSGVLIGIEVDPEKVDGVASAINTIPGVTHNYLREGSRNLWCTLTCDGAAEREHHLAFMRALGGVIDLKVFSSEKTYKIGLVLDV
jgi:DNA-binding Lrp family transcriptional regulator